MGVDDFLRWLGAATLVAGAVWAGLSMVSRVTAPNTASTVSAAIARVAVGLSLLAQTAALLLHGVNAQVATGSYWNWSRLECWQLAGWLATAMLGIGLGRLGWERRGALIGLILATTFVLFAVLGAPLVVA